MIYPKNLIAALEDVLVFNLIFFCFFIKFIVKVRRMNEHFGNDNQDYTYMTAFEYQQNDFHYFRLNGSEKMNKVRDIKDI